MCYLWPVLLCHILPHFLINGTIFEKKKSYLTKMWILIFYTNLSKTFLVLRMYKWDIIINVHRISCKIPLFLTDFNETSIFQTHFRNILKYQISLNSFQRGPSCSMQKDRQTDRHDEGKSRFSQSCESAQKSVDTSRNSSVSTLS